MLVVGFLLVLMFVPSLVLSQTVGEVVKARGRVSIVKKGTFKGVSWEVDPSVGVGDTVRTKRRSSAVVRFVDNTEVTLDERTRLVVEAYVPHGEAEVRNPSGKVIYKVSRRARGMFRVRTPTALIGVKGTEFVTVSTPTVVAVFVKRGEVEVVNPQFPEVKVRVKANTASFVSAGAPPTPPKEVAPEVLEKVFKVKEEKEEKAEERIERKEEKEAEVKTVKEEKEVVEEGKEVEELRGEGFKEVEKGVEDTEVLKTTEEALSFEYTESVEEHVIETVQEVIQEEVIQEEVEILWNLYPSLFLDVSTSFGLSDVNLDVNLHSIVIDFDLSDVVLELNSLKSLKIDLNLNPVNFK